MLAALINKTCLLTFFLIVAFTAVPICGHQSEPVEAYFIFDCPPNKETFVIKLTDLQTIQQARNIIATGARNLVAGTLIKQPVYYNSPWSYYLDPKSIGFPEFAVEVCDANMFYLESNLDTAYADWCPWNSRLIKEVPLPEKPGTENIAPTISMKFPHADNTYTDVSPASVTLVANADDPDGKIVKVSFNNGNVIGESTTYPYKFTWHPLAAGRYTVSATAIDDKGASTTSRSVTFLINGNSSTAHRYGKFQSCRTRISDFIKRTICGDFRTFLQFR
jgi:Bacterial Ig domain